MARRLMIAPRAERDLAAMPRGDRQSVRRAVLRLADDFGGSDVRKLGGRADEWRLRVGRWRVIFQVSEGGTLITVTRVLARDRAYRD